MIKKDNFFKSYFIKSKYYKKNLEKTKKIFNYFLDDLKKDKIPLLQSFEKEYKFNFTLNTVKKFSKYENIIIIGMGGSILGVKSIHSFFRKKIKKKVFFFDNLDPNLFYEYKKISKLKNSCFVIVSKSGNTLETITNFSILYSQKNLKKRLVIITELTDNILIALANKYQAELIPHNDFIGGRYSVLSETGMFPAALMGLNLNNFKNLKNLLEDKNFTSSLIHNVACIHTLNLKNINNSVIMTYDSSLNDLGYWYQQLVAESLGKKGKGINPQLSFCPKDHHSLLQLYLGGAKNKFFTFFNSSKKNNKFKLSKSIFHKNMKFLKNKDLNSVIDTQSEALKKIFKLKKIPYRQINFKKKNEKEIGKIFTFFVLETILLSRLMKLNAFDQPEVEKVKTETKKLLRR